jgi:hypothetical protein
VSVKSERYFDRSPKHTITNRQPENDTAQRNHEQMMREGSEALLSALFKFFYEREARG